MRDIQQKKVYNWEDTFVHPKDKKIIPFGQIISIVNYVWQNEGLDNPPKVEQMPKQARNFRATGSRYRVRFSYKGEFTFIILHELSHSLINDIDGNAYGHGPKFVGIYMYLLSKYGKIPFAELMYTTSRCNVEYELGGATLIESGK